MKKPRIYLSSTASYKDNIKDALVELFKWGFLDIELSGGTNFYEGIEEDLFKLRRIYGLNFLVHNYFPPLKRHILMDICSEDKAIKNDTFHLNFDRHKIIKKIFADYPDKVFEVHLSENDGGDDDHKVSQADSWQGDVLRQNKGQLEDCPIVLEWWGAFGQY